MRNCELLARPIFQQPFSLPESARTLAGIAFRAARKSVRTFPAASKFARKLFQQGISDSHSLLVLLFLGVFVSLVFFLLGISLVFWSVFCSFPSVQKVRKVRKILAFFEVFLGIFEKTKEKKDRAATAFSSFLNFRVLDDRFSARRLLRSFGAPPPPPK